MLMGSASDVPVTCLSEDPGGLTSRPTDVKQRGDKTASWGLQCDRPVSAAMPQNLSAFFFDASRAGPVLTSTFRSSKCVPRGHVSMRHCEKKVMPYSEHKREHILDKEAKSLRIDVAEDADENERSMRCAGVASNKF